MLCSSTTTGTPRGSRKQHIELDSIRLPACEAPIVVEGAGGVMVPLNERELMVDLMARLDLPVVLVARTSLGTINHTLLSLECLRRRGLKVAAVLLDGPANPANRAAIELFGAAPTSEVPMLDPLGPDAVARAAVGLAALFGG